MSCQCEGVYTSDPMGYAWVFGSTRDIKRGERGQKPLIFMHFHVVLFGNWPYTNNRVMKRKVPVSPSQETHYSLVFGFE